MSVSHDRGQSNGTEHFLSLGSDGRFVVFGSYATNLVPGDTNGLPDIFLYDHRQESIERVNVSRDGTQADGRSSNCAISADSIYVTFGSFASNLGTNWVADIGHTDVFVTLNSAARPDEARTVDLADRRTGRRRRFGSRPRPGQIRGRLFDDKNRNGVHDTNELPLDGWTVYLDRNANDLLDSGEALRKIPVRLVSTSLTNLSCLQHIR